MRRWGLVAILSGITIAASGGMASAGAAADSTTHAAVVPFGQPRPRSIDDGWRRTADGWENVADWPAYVAAATMLGSEERRHGRNFASPEQLALVPGWRLDFHPAGLALVQVALLAWLAVRSSGVDENS